MSALTGLLVKNDKAVVLSGVAKSVLGRSMKRGACTGRCESCTLASSRSLKCKIGFQGKHQSWDEVVVKNYLGDLKLVPTCTRLAQEHKTYLKDLGGTLVGGIRLLLAPNLDRPFIELSQEMEKYNFFTDKTKIPCSLKLDTREIRLLSIIGDGQVTRGIERLVEQDFAKNCNLN